MEIQLEIFGLMGGVLGLERVFLVSQQIILRTIGIPSGQLLESQLSMKCENVSPFIRLRDLSNNGNSSVAIVSLCLVRCEGELCSIAFKIL